MPSAKNSHKHTKGKAMSRAIGIVAVVAFVVGLGVWSVQKYHSYHFKAQTTNGEVSMDTFLGKYKIVYFGYMSCPDVCPATLGLLQESLQDLQDETDLSDVAVLFITLDPKRDSLKALDSYVKHFYPNAYGLRFDEQTLQEVTKRYGVKYEIIPLKDSKLGYSIAHSSSLYLFDKQGFLTQEVSNLATLKDDLLSFFANH